MFNRLIAALLSIIALAVPPAASQSGETLVPYPDTFRSWRHTKSAYIGPGPGHDRFVAGWHDAWPRALDRLEAYLAPAASPGAGA